MWCKIHTCDASVEMRHVLPEDDNTLGAGATMDVITGEQHTTLTNNIDNILK